MAKYNFDCIKFRGYKPCVAKKTCDRCDEYEPWERKIVIVKLGALGDVMRTTPVLYAFRRKYPRAHITWVTKRNAKDMLDTCPRINRLVYVDQPDGGGVLRLLAEEFDEMHCYDKEDAAIGLATLIKAKKKFGFHMNPQGQMAPINAASEYCFDLGMSDDLKFNKNDKSYQEVTYQCSELAIPRPMDPYDFTLTEPDREAARFILKRLRWESKKGVVRPPIIGLNTGAGRVFRTKQWLEEYFLELARQLKKKSKARILLLGGEDEDARNKRLASKLKGVAHYPGCGFGIRQFAGLLEQCDLVVTGDTLAMHLALATETPTVVLFGSTCEQEVDLYGLGRKLVGRPACAPCYKNECDQPDWMRCMKDLTPSQVYRSVVEVLSDGGRSGPTSPA
ncbi:MAG: glycosyltransferase family 9 protein [Deltaproteobacteria bacterium]|nr:glycosyltransferase family 9 protein [Deltaproteobacteria bacterium]